MYIHALVTECLKRWLTRSRWSILLSYPTFSRTCPTTGTMPDAGGDSCTSPTAGLVRRPINHLSHNRVSDSPNDWVISSSWRSLIPNREQTEQTGRLMMTPSTTWSFSRDLLTSSFISYNSIWRREIRARRCKGLRSYHCLPHWHL